MQLKTPLVLLLAGLLSASQVDAVPLISKRASTSITLPLRRFHHVRDVHPLINLQQNINRAVRRLARMTGRDVPSDEVLSHMLHKRVVSLGGEEGLARRFNHQGVPSRKKTGSVLKTGQVLKSSNDAAGSQVNGVTVAQTPATPDSLALSIEGTDISYITTVKLGGRNFDLLMDSGSADLWVGSETCKSEAGGGCGNHKFLGPKSSATFKDSQQPFNVTYGSGNVAGTIVQDNLKIGNFSLPGHTFGVADLESVQFADNSVPFDGLMGLAQSRLSQQGALTPPEALVKAGLVQEAITSFKISRLADNKNDGEVTFGALDTTKFDPKTLTTVDNVSKNGFWEAPLDAVTVDGQDAGLQSRTAILDTGTTLILAPLADATALHQLIPGSQADGQGGFSIPCTSNAKVALTFGGRQFNIDFRDIAVQPVDPQNPNGDCISGITGANIGGPTEWLVGDVFLKNAYFSTNVNRNQLSLAQLV